VSESASRIELVDETFVAAAPAQVAAVLADPHEQQRWWPGWQLSVFMDRGVQGTRWTVHGRLDGLVVRGSSEVWLEPVLDGVVLHHYLRVSTDGSVARTARAKRRYVRRWKRVVFALKDRLEAGRSPGAPAVGSSTGTDLPTTPS